MDQKGGAQKKRKSKKGIPKTTAVSGIEQDDRLHGEPTGYDNQLYNNN